MRAESVDEVQEAQRVRGGLAQTGRKPASLLESLVQPRSLRVSLPAVRRRPRMLRLCRLAGGSGPEGTEAPLEASALVVRHRCGGLGYREGEGYSDFGWFWGVEATSGEYDPSFLNEVVNRDSISIVCSSLRLHSLPSFTFVHLATGFGCVLLALVPRFLGIFASSTGLRRPHC